MNDALILAAGRGTRLGALNGGRPKCLTMIGTKSILEHQLSAIAFAGLRRVVMVTGFERELLEDTASSLAAQYGLKVEFVHNDEFATTNVLASWMAAAPCLHGPYVYMHGDTVFEPALLSRLLEQPIQTGVTITYDRHPCGDEEMKITLVGGRVATISKTMDPATAAGEFTGVLACTAEAHRTLERVARDILSGPQARTAFFEAALQSGIDHGTIDCRPVDITGLRWREIDFPEDLNAATAMFA